MHVSVVGRHGPCVTCHRSPARVRGNSAGVCGSGASAGVGRDRARIRRDGAVIRPDDPPTCVRRDRAPACVRRDRGIVSPDRTRIRRDRAPIIRIDVSPTCIRRDRAPIIRIDVSPTCVRGNRATCCVRPDRAIVSRDRAIVSRDRAIVSRDRPVICPNRIRVGGQCGSAVYVNGITPE